VDVNNDLLTVTAADGTLFTTLTLADEYSGYPTFSWPAANLGYAGATIGDINGVPIADPGSIYFIGPPYKAEPAILVSQFGVLPPSAWLDDNYLVVGYSSDGTSWGTAIVGIDGSFVQVQPFPQAQYVAVWPQEEATTGEDLGMGELLVSQSTSPDGQWMVEVATGDPFSDPATGGEAFYARMTVTRPSDGSTWTLYDGQRPYGMGYTVPAVFSWSADGQRLYYTNTPVPDGCVAAVNGSDLWLLDLNSGAQTQIVPDVGLVLALSPDEQDLAYVGYGDRGLVVRDIAGGAEQSIPLQGSGWQTGGLYWSPDGSQLLVVQSYDFCGGEGRTGLALVNPSTGEARTVVESHSPALGVMEWGDPAAVLLQDASGQTYRLDTASGALTAE
jgi:hypothetical protein